ncbi:hypothetical protein J437_LFUL015699 [Ladona fulva]|uniref:Uncharacterized protein n=1 Tax=Ladona fulva TaxID=123851 RepID=A0A8K0KPM9_LADFU|nr:hypothetical protein J437_LFUL015699 [Ladona fulva]
MYWIETITSKSAWISSKTTKLCPSTRIQPPNFRQPYEKHYHHEPPSPRFYGLPKLHKQGHPIRPVVSGISSPAHKLAFKLNNVIRDTTGFSPKYGIKNSLDLANKLSAKTFPQDSYLYNLFRHKKSILLNIPG